MNGAAKRLNNALHYTQSDWLYDWVDPPPSLYPELVKNYYFFEDVFDDVVAEEEV